MAGPWALTPSESTICRISYNPIRMSENDTESPAYIDLRESFWRECFAEAHTYDDSYRTLNLDTNQDKFVTPIDSLRIINYLNQNATSAPMAQQRTEQAAVDVMASTPPTELSHLLPQRKKLLEIP